MYVFWINSPFFEIYNLVPAIKCKFCITHCMTYIKWLWLPLTNTKRKVDICCWLMISKQDSTCQTVALMGILTKKDSFLDSFFFRFQACKNNWIEFDNSLQLVYWWFVSWLNCKPPMQCSMYTSWNNTIFLNWFAHWTY